MSPLLAAVLPCIFGNLLLRVASAAAGSAIALNLAFMRRTTGDVDPTFVGWLAVAFYTSELVTAPFFGSLSDRFGRQRFMLLGTLLGIVAVLFLPFLPLLPLFLVARSLEGLSSGSSVPAVLGHLSVETSKAPQLRSRIMAGFEVATILGLALGYATAGILWDKLHTTAYFPIAGIYLAALLVFLLVRGGNDDGHAAAETHHGIDLRTYRELLRDKAVAGFLPAWVAVNAILGLWGTHLSFQMAGTRMGRQFLVGGFSGTQIGYAQAGIGISLIVGTAIWAFGFARVRNLKVMSISTLGIAFIALLILALNRTDHGDDLRVGGLIALIGFGMLIAAGFTPAALAYLAELSERFPAKRGSLMGLYSVLLGGGQLVGGWLGGFFAHQWAVDGLVLLTALLGGAAMAGLFIISRIPEPEPGLHPVTAGSSGAATHPHA